jgi:hypothetical protein
VWPDHSKAEHGEYNLTFDQANRRLAAPAGLLPSSTVEVIVVRDPDRSNDHTIVIDGKASADATSRPVRVITHDLDLGARMRSPPLGLLPNWDGRRRCLRPQPPTPAM